MLPNHCSCVEWRTVEQIVDAFQFSAKKKNCRGDEVCSTQVQWIDEQILECRKLRKKLWSFGLSHENACSNGSNKHIVEWSIPQITETVSKSLILRHRKSEKMCDQIVNVFVAQFDEQDLVLRTVCIGRGFVEHRRAFELSFYRVDNLWPSSFV